MLDKRRMKRLLFRLSVVLFSFLTGNGFGAPSWGHYQHDNAHTGRTNVPFLFVNGCNPVLTRGVVWVYSDTQTYAYDSRTLELLRVFDGSAGFNHGFEPLGAFVSDTAALNTTTGGVSVYQTQSLLGIR